MTCKIYEAGAGSGGTWWWNAYPGCRADSVLPSYQLFDKDLVDGWTFSKRFPDRNDIRRYFEYVEEKWDLKKDIVFSRRVVTAEWDEARPQYLITCDDGTKAKCQWLIISTGLLGKKYIPEFPGFDRFTGQWYHTGSWPQEGVDLKGKKVSIIGTGTSSLQVIRETAPIVEHLTIYQRTPNYACPMNQKDIDPKEAEEQKKSGWYDEQIALCRRTYSGFPIEAVQKDTFDDPPEVREAFWHDLLVVKGGFHFWIAGYRDFFLSEKANYAAYEFWRDTVRKRIPDAKKQKLLAPDKPPHPWGTKRPSLEQNFYEMISLPHVDIIDINIDPIVGITESGIETSSSVIDADIIIFATGWDAGVSSLCQIDIRGVNGAKVKSHFKNGYYTSLGIGLSDFPNNSLGTPAFLSNNPTLIHLQAEWLDGFIKKVREEGKNRIEASRDTEEAWKAESDGIWAHTLLPKAKSWYQGANIEGKRVETVGW